MSNKRPLSPESTNCINNDEHLRSLKRFKLHSIIQELRNEEANLVLLKKLRASQQLATRTNNTTNNNSTTTKTTTTTTTTINGFHPTAARVLSSKPTTLIPSSIKSLQQPISSATRKPTNPTLPTKLPAPVPGKNSSSSTIYTLEERKNQAKKTLRNQLERDLLNIPAPKPLLQDISFIPNPNSLEFQPYIGLEDVVQCLYELQTERQRLPQRFTDRAQIDEPYVCEHCGTDYTIRWWKHLNVNNQQINILCDRCKKQVTRRTLKSEHSTLLKNVFVLAMEQEKEIEKNFQALIKQQQKATPRTPPSAVPSKPITHNRPIPPPPPPPITTTVIPSFNHNHHHVQPKKKTSSVPPQAHNFATKLSQQSAPPSSNTAARKTNVVPQPSVNRIPQSNKTPMPAHQQQYRSASALPHQQTKPNPMMKLPKTAARQPPSVVPNRPLFPPTSGLIPPANLHSSIPLAMNIRPTATKRRTLPPVNMK